MSAAAPLLGRELPPFVHDLLGSAPKVGEGVNPWLYRTARVLHPYRHNEEIIALLQAATFGERIRNGEIERAVKNSEAAAWQPGEPLSGCSSANAAWPPVDENRRREIIAVGPDAAELCERSPVGFDVDDGSSAPEIIEQLFSTAAMPDPLVCVGKSNADFATRLLSFWIRSEKLACASLIVPSLMSARTGQTKEGKASEHTLQNTGSRRFLVVEFDQGSFDDHAALLWHLSEIAPLAMVVHSGGKSLHGWFFCQGETEENLRRFMRYTVSIGADRATWTRSQFVRLPGGLRENGARQNVFYFDPAIIQRTEATHEE
jgi:hypothetical protein